MATLYVYPFIINSCHWFQAVGKALFRAHVEGQLKVDFFSLLWLLKFVLCVTITNKLVASLQNEIMSKPELFVEPDPELPLALLDQKEVILVFVNCLQQMKSFELPF